MGTLLQQAVYVMAQIKPDRLPGFGRNSTDITNGRVQIAIAIVFSLLAGIAVVIITIAGLQYVLSQGDPQKTAKAKNTIIYAVVGLLVAISGYTIITFVIKRVA